MRVPRIGLPIAGLLLVVGLLAPASVSAVDPEGSWADAGSVSAPRIFPTLTRLMDGAILLTGGQDGQGEISDVRLYDADANSWSWAAPLSIPRSRHSATLLQNGTVFVAGGLNADTRPQERRRIDGDLRPGNQQLGVRYAHAPHAISAHRDGAQ